MNKYLIDYKNEELVRTFTDLLTQFLKKRNFMFIKIDPQIIYKSHENTGEITDLVDNETIFNTLINCGYQHGGFNLNFEKEAYYNYLNYNYGIIKANT